MANLLFMGFERLIGTYLNHANIWDVTAFNNAAYSTTAPRNGGSQQCLSSDSFERSGIKALGANFTHLFAGFGYMIRNAAISASPTNCTLRLMDGATTQVGLKVRSDGSISIHAGGNTSATLLGQTATGVIVAAGSSGTGADYKMIELEVICHASAGEIRVRVADVEVLNVTGLNTAPTGVAQINRVSLLTCASGSMTERIDDFYINDDSGSAPDNTYYGEAFVVESCIPNGNGNSSQWVGSDGNSTDNYLLVDDTGNNDTDYIASGTLNDLDLHALSDLSNATGTVIGVNHYMVARKDDVATRTIASTIRTNSTNYVGSDKAMTGTYATYVENRLLNPDTSLRFTISEVNALEAGEKVTT